MGFILSKFRRQKLSTKDELEKMDKELREIQRFTFDTELEQKKVIGKLVIFSSVIYLLCAAAYYLFGPIAQDWTDRLLYIAPFIVFPFLIWLTKRLMNWYYTRTIKKNREKYDYLKKEKQKVLDDVMEKETFKVAREILEKYAPGQLMSKALAEKMNLNMASSMSPLGNSPLNSVFRQNSPNSSQFQEGLRRRQMMGAQGMLSSTPSPRPYPGSTPMGPRPMRAIQGVPPGYAFRPLLQICPPPQDSGHSNGFATNRNSLPPSGPGGNFRQQAPGSPRMMIRAPSPPANPVYSSRSGGWFDKLVEYVVGDGPSSRFALICRYCGTHNGLATTEEFPYIGYRCVFCRQYNPPRQVRPSAPKLESGEVVIEEADRTADSTTGGESPRVSLAGDSSGDESSRRGGEGNSVEEMASSRETSQLEEGGDGAEEEEKKRPENEERQTPTNDQEVEEEEAEGDGEGEQDLPKKEDESNKSPTEKFED